MFHGTSSLLYDVLLTGFRPSHRASCHIPGAQSPLTDPCSTKPYLQCSAIGTYAPARIAPLSNLNREYRGHFSYACSVR
jgi:hypothetical protein